VHRNQKVRMTDPHSYRVAVTGLGTINALGHSVGAVWKEIVAGRSAIAEVASVDSSMLHAKVAAEVKGYDENAHFEERDLEWLDRFAQFALVAAREAIGDAGIDFQKDGLAEETATVVASGIGGYTTIDRAYVRLFKDNIPRARPSTIPRLMISAAASQVSMMHGLTGPTFCVSSACSSANHAIGEAYWMVRSGRVRAAVTGGAEATITLGSQRSWESLRVMATDTCRPFSKGRRGMVIGEGAGILVLERLEDARARGATVYAEIVGYGASADAGDIVMPSEHGAARAIRQALTTAGLNPEDVGYVNAHGTGTQLNDVTETKALKMVFGEAAKALQISSTKSMHGHTLGAAGALEAVATVKALSQGVIPPTANYLGPDPECDLDYVPNEARDGKVAAAISNSFAFGGLNAVLAFRAV
jgi:nodulation protein E